MSIAQPALEQPADSERLSTKPPRVPRPQQWKGLDEAAVISLAGLADLAADMRPASLPARTHRSEREMVSSCPKGSVRKQDPAACVAAKVLLERRFVVFWEVTPSARRDALATSRTPAPPCPPEICGLTDAAIFYQATDMGLLERMSHKQVEQFRRQKAKEYFEELRELLPNNTDHRCDRNK